MNSTQRVAIVTGASRGIGAGLVAGYRRLGYRVVATSRSIAPSSDEHVLAVAGDIRDRATAQKVVVAAKERFGRVDTLVNNAGIFIAKPFLEYTQEDFDAVTATNVTGFFHITQAVLAELLAQRSGHVVNITASLVDQPLASVPAGLAALTKGGLNALTKSLAIEVAKRGVRVNAVAPGLIKTPMHAPGTHEFLAKLIPVGRMGQVQDIVDAVLYLESASFVTGEICHVDGGEAAGVGGPLRFQTKEDEMIRKSMTEWKGDGPTGSGSLSTESGVLSAQPYSVKTRFQAHEGKATTNPEELLGAALAACFAMTVAFVLTDAGHAPRQLKVTAAVDISKVGEGFAITSITLELEARVEGFGADQFRALAEAAKANCPVSKALSATPISLTSRLV